ncbi:MAG: four helix bundle protein [Saprospiraceae bacterium]|nr:four helix bundle protein [Saprospiraceae bacterium]
MEKPVKLEDLEIYQLALDIGEYVWAIVLKWEYFPKKTVGAQFVEAADSISANIAEATALLLQRQKAILLLWSWLIIGNKKLGYQIKKSRINEPS